LLVMPSVPRKARPDQLKPRAKRVRWRLYVQIIFAGINVVLCVQFYHFVRTAQTTLAGPLPYRPAGVEGWLPISGLMGAIDWLAHGSLNPVHPAATILLLAFITLTLLLRKVFCSWLCPVGSLSELLALIGRKIFSRNFLPPRWIDRPLMALKYVLLAFFLWAFYAMGVTGISQFIHSPYNQVADVKMLLFFAQLSAFAAIVLGVLAAGSLFIKGFWCRYLCPYGALLGLFSWMAPAKIRRNAANCIDCAKCDKVCPARLPIMVKKNIISVECTGCMECIEACPVKDTLHFGTRKRRLTAGRVAALVAAVFLIFYLGAHAFGTWQTSVTDEAYRHHIANLNSRAYGHPGMGE
jgi:polyferredoxin